MGVFFAHNASKVRTPYDSLWTLHTTHSLLHERNASLDEFETALAAKDYYGTSMVEGNRVYFFPHGTSLLLAPLLLATEPFLPTPDGLTLEQTLRTRVVPKLERLYASFLVALTAVVLLLALQLHTGELRVAVTTTLLFAFATSAWSVSSRALWAHSASMLFLSLTLWAVFAARRDTRWVKWIAVPLALSYIMRPTNSLSVIVWSTYVLFAHRKQFLPYLLCATPVALLFFAYNVSVFGQLLPDYYLPGRIGLHSQLPLALAGNLVSPARGLLVYTPYLVFGVASLLRASASQTHMPRWPWVTLLVGHWFMISAFEHWWAGHSYGPRLFTDVLPYAMVWMVAPVASLFRRGSRWKQALLVVLIVIAAAIHGHGANSKDAWRWNSEPIDVDHQPDRVWDWSDPQFLRS